jgi:hypothetical protein
MQVTVYRDKNRDGIMQDVTVDAGGTFIFGEYCFIM